MGDLVERVGSCDMVGMIKSVELGGRYHVRWGDFEEKYVNETQLRHYRPSTSVDWS